MTVLTCPIDSRAAGILLRRATADGWQWLLLRDAKRGEWGFPKGHLDPGESELQAAMRECVEECGISIFALDPGEDVLLYHVPSGKSKSVVYFSAVTAAAAGTDSVTLSSEHSAFQWCSAKATAAAIGHANLRHLFSDHAARLSP